MDKEEYYMIKSGEKVVACLYKKLTWKQITKLLSQITTLYQSKDYQEFIKGYKNN